MSGGSCRVTSRKRSKIMLGYLCGSTSVMRVRYATSLAAVDPRPGPITTPLSLAQRIVSEVNRKKSGSFLPRIISISRLIRAPCQSWTACGFFPIWRKFQPYRHQRHRSPSAAISEVSARTLRTVGLVRDAELIAACVVESYRTLEWDVKFYGWRGYHSERDV